MTEGVSSGLTCLNQSDHDPSKHVETARKNVKYAMFYTKKSKPVVVVTSTTQELTKVFLVQTKI